MPKNWTDAEFEVVSPEEPQPRPLPRWFKTGMFLLLALFLIATAVWRAGGLGNDHPTAPRSPAAAPAEPTAPDAR
jgi:hypothetical protein